MVADLCAQLQAFNAGSDKYSPCVQSSEKGNGEHIIFIAAREALERESNVGLAAHLPSQTRWPYSLCEVARFAHMRCCPDSESSPADSEVCLHTLLSAQFPLALFL